MSENTAEQSEGFKRGQHVLIECRTQAVVILSDPEAKMARVRTSFEYVTVPWTWLSPDFDYLQEAEAA